MLIFVFCLFLVLSCIYCCLTQTNMMLFHWLSHTFTMPKIKRMRIIKKFLSLFLIAVFFSLKLIKLFFRTETLKHCALTEIVFPKIKSSGIFCFYLWFFAWTPQKCIKRIAWMAAECISEKKKKHNPLTWILRLHEVQI